MSLNATLRMNYSKNLNNKIVNNAQSNSKRDDMKKPTVISKSLKIDKSKTKLGKSNKDAETEKYLPTMPNNENDKNGLNICANLNKEFFSKRDAKEAKKNVVEALEVHSVNDDNMNGTISKEKKTSRNFGQSNYQNDLNVTMKSSKDDSAVKEAEAEKMFRENVLGEVPKVIDLKVGQVKNENKDEKKNDTRKQTPFDVDTQNESNSTKTVVSNNFLNKTIKSVQIDLRSQTTITHNYENLVINKQNPPKFTNEEYRRMFTKLVRKDYSKSILNNLFEEEESIEDPLETHKVTERMRVRMVDWMIEVLANYKCDDNSFFHAINIMDRFFKQNEGVKSLQPGELHLMGVTAMFMASKYQDIYPLRLRVVHEKIAHRKLPIDDIKRKEEEISKSLSYILGKPSQWDFINHFVEEIFYTSHNNYHITDKNLLEYYLDIDRSNSSEKDKFALFTKLYNPNMLKLLKHVTIYLAKMNSHDYSLVSKKPSLIAASTIYVAMKICEQINKEEYVHDYFTRRLTDVSNKNENDIIKCAQKILYNAQNFDTIFSGLENLKRVHFNAIIELKNTK